MRNQKLYIDQTILPQPICCNMIDKKYIYTTHTYSDDTSFIVPILNFTNYQYCTLYIYLPLRMKLFRFVVLCCTVPGYPGDLLAVLADIFLLLHFRRGFIGYQFKFSSVCIILFAVDLSFPIFVLNMSVAVILSLLSSMRDRHYSNICSCVSVLLPHALQFGYVFLLW